MPLCVLFGWPGPRRITIVDDSQSVIFYRFVWIRMLTWQMIRVLVRLKGLNLV